MMRKARRMRWTLLVALATLGSCVLPVEVNIGDGTHVRGSGHVVAEARSVAPFDGIQASGAVIVDVVETGSERVTVRAEDNLLPYLETYVEGGMLHIGFRSGVSVSPRRDVVVEVDAFEIVELRASGAVRIDAALGWTPQMWVGLSGASSLLISGEADELNADLSGASRLDALDYRTLHADIGVSGASQAFVWVLDRLDAQASGASHVRFRGRPEVRASVSGASTVTPY
jgi:hypothetical protein